VLVNVAFLLWACGVAMRFRSVQAGPIMQTPVFLILFFAPVYVPLRLLTGWIHAIAVVNPLTRVIDAARSLIAGAPAGVGAGFLTGIVLAALLSLWAVRGLRSAERAG
jgi:ABC-2 type transport system permease protein